MKKLTEFRCPNPKCGHTIATHRWAPGHFANLTGCKRFDECGCYYDRKELWEKLGKPPHRFVAGLLGSALCRLCREPAKAHAEPESRQKRGRQKP